VAAHVVPAMANGSGGVDYLNFGHVNTVFIFVSGYLFQYLLQGFSYPKFLKTKVLTVALPYLIVSLPAMAIYLAGLKDLEALHAPAYVQGDVMLAGYMLLTGTHLGPLWFIPVILLLYLAAPILKLMDDRPQAYWLIIPLLMLAYYVGRPLENNNPLEAFAFSLPAYVLGMGLSHFHERALPLLEKYWPLFMIPFLGSAFMSESQLVDTDLSVPAQSFILMVTKLCLSLGLTGALCVHAARLPDRFNRIGDLSFGIYLLHGYIASAMIMTALHEGWRFEGIPVFILLSVILIVATIAAVMAAKRIFGRYSRYIIGA